MYAHAGCLYKGNVKPLPQSKGLHFEGELQEIILELCLLPYSSLFGVMQNDQKSIRKPGK